jgi:hypothetical protein
MPHRVIQEIPSASDVAHGGGYSILAVCEHCYRIDQEFFENVVVGAHKGKPRFEL